MAFEGLREQIKDKLVELGSQVQETSLFNNLREKFESQTPTGQKAIVAIASFLVVLFLFSFPYSNIGVSQENLSIFEESRDLIRGLLSAARTAREAPPLPAPLDASALKSRISQMLQDKRLLPEQIGEMRELPNAKENSPIPDSIIHTGVAVELKKLNVQQIVDLGASFDSLSVGTKLAGLDIVQSVNETHYYDMIARVINFGIQPLAIEDSGPSSRRKAPAKKADSEEDSEP